ncbi:MAG: hypothetical protein K0A95_08840 [Chromatiales bacterium]|nr:hypothetical protein [Gammaproteobacteria bacterium]MBW6477164.1 hypothetical protein [Chromatiales bacterium]
MRRLNTGILLLLSLPLAAMEPLDIRANLLEMFEQGLRDGSAERILDSAGREVVRPAGMAPGTRAVEGDLFEQLEIRHEPTDPQTLLPADPAPQHRTEQPRPAPSARVQVHGSEAYLPLQEIEITISGPEDLKRLQQEFDEARQRQQQAR